LRPAGQLGCLHKMRGALGGQAKCFLPERHSASLIQGREIAIGEGETGLLVKIYPQIENGRVLGDVELAGLDTRFTGRRVPVDTVLVIPAIYRVYKM